MELEATFHGPDYALGDHAPARVRAYCFIGEHLLLVRRASGEGWETPVGDVREGESVNDAAKRIVRCQGRMQMTSMRIIGYFEFTGENAGFEAIVTCGVDPIHHGIEDHDIDVVEAKAVNLPDVHEYIQWNPFMSGLLHTAHKAYEGANPSVFR